MDKRFDPASYEDKWQRWWGERGFFVAEAPSSRLPFCILIPPPNVTGRLHMGHAVQSTIQDLLTRWRRMQGRNALWLPGTDHAGIATQLMVERQLAVEGTSRAELGRERFLERMWAWTEEHHGGIRVQLDRLGASCDWTRERFTLDEGLSRAVRTAFVRLHRDGLIYRGDYIVNWSPVLDTAISDLEVEMREVRGRLFHISYPVEGSSERLVVTTTRPETMLGDTALAVHPADARYRHLVGRAALLPLVGRRLPVIADQVVDAAFGTGVVKVTPFHDAVDFEIGRRHGLPAVQVIDRHGRMTAEAGPDFAGLDRFAAREAVVERLRGEGRLLAVEEHVHHVGHCQRSGEPVEPLVSTQWFCDVSEMAARALRGEESGRRLELVPDTWQKSWEHWLGHLRPWCISRQLWWGHRIPAWYTTDGRCFVAHDAAEASAQAEGAGLEQDADVLDTWFSSALWPFSTLGWPEETVDLATFYPTSVLVTGFDILYFWVARMVMVGLHFTGRLPFATVHLTGLVRDAEGHKMSKTRGNVVDPLELVEEYGADALRFTLAALDAPGRDIPVDRERMAGYRAFGNKIWNAVRFTLSRVGAAAVQTRLDPASLAAPERWILSRLSRVEREVNAKFDGFRFDEACRVLHGFFWGELCDWYIELVKPALAEAPRPQVGEVLLTVLEHSLRLLHPVMPFLTEELWQRLPGREAVHADTIVLAPYPAGESSWEDGAIEDSMNQFIALVTWVRNRRAALGLPPRLTLDVDLEPEEARLAAFLAEHAPLARALAGVGAWRFGPPPPTASRDRVGGVGIGLSAAGRDLAAEERAQVDAELVELAEQMLRVESLLADPGFLARAPGAVVERNRSRLSSLRERRSSLEAARARRP